jgi:hypothetical protein
MPGGYAGGECFALLGEPRYEPLKPCDLIGQIYMTYQMTTQ